MPYLFETMPGSFEVRVEQGGECSCVVFDEEFYGSSAEAFEAGQAWCSERIIPFHACLS